ncbi:MAG TPA: hypothetical protein VFA11_12025 [Acidimicrobiales bacterium]|nr:hypothetical protein [Acidimicrobiales bacterium]
MPTSLGLECSDLATLGARWADGGLWSDIEALAARAWAAPDGPERYLAWHHLLMAVGNFKRQPGRRVYPAPLPAVLHVRPPRSPSFAVPGTGHVVAEEDEASWTLRIHGLGVPTLTPLLAALWPGSHHVLDWRVFAGVVALTLGGPEDLDLVRPGDVAALPDPTLAHYAQVRTVLRRVVDECPEFNLPLVERAAYELTQSVVGAQPGTRTWGQYRQELLLAASQ